MFNYEPETGILMRYGKAAGFLNNRDLSKATHYRVMWEGKYYEVSHLVWTKLYGTKPEKIWHLNGCILDNRKENLVDSKVVKKKMEYNMVGNYIIDSNGIVVFEHVAWDTRLRHFLQLVK